VVEIYKLRGKYSMLIRGMLKFRAKGVLMGEEIPVMNSDGRLTHDEGN
jgi:hypothetical protein